MRFPASSPEGFFPQPQRPPPSLQLQLVAIPQPPPPPPPGFEQEIQMSQPRPTTHDYYPVYDQQKQKYIFVPTHNNGSQPQALNRPTMAEQLVLKKHRTQAGEAATPSTNSIPAFTPPSTQQLSVIVPSTLIPPPPTSPPPPVPPPPASPMPQSPQSSAERTSTPPPPLPTSPLQAPQLPPPAEPTSPSQQLPERKEFQSFAESMFPAAQPPPSAGPASPPPESTKPIDQSQGFQDREIASPLLCWLTNLDSQRKKEALNIQETNMHENEDCHTLGTQDMVGTHLFGNSWEVPLEIPSSPEETKPDLTLLSRLKSTPKSHKLKSNLSHERMNLVRPVVSHLVFELLNAEDVNSMIDLANGTFMYLDSLNVDYTPVHKAVHVFISYHCEKEALEIQKKGPAFVTMAHHHELVSCLCDAELAQSRAHSEVEKVQQKLAPLRATTEEIREQLRKAKEELEEVEKDLADAEAEMVLCDDDYSRAEADVIEITPKMDKAEVIIDGVERRWDEAVAGIKEKTDELLLLRK